MNFYFKSFMLINCRKGNKKGDIIKEKKYDIKMFTNATILL